MPKIVVSLLPLVSLRLSIQAKATRCKPFPDETLDHSLREPADYAILRNMSDSVFTMIINGELPSHRIYEDSKCIVIMDIHPVQPGHSLVIPKKQIESIWDLDSSLYHHLWDVSNSVAKKLLEVTGSKRVSIIVDGEQVPHAHIQLIPTNEANDLHATPPSDPDHQALSQMAQKLKLED